MKHSVIHSEAQSLESTPLQAMLANLRRELGFRSARAFFTDYLQVRTRLDFNYSYYMKIEGGKIIPSPQIISNLCAALETGAADHLMLSYCEMIFPERATLFQRKKGAPKNVVKTIPAPVQTSTDLMLSAQKFLTPAQVACIGKSKHYYYTFLLLTLARKPISMIELKATFPQGTALDLKTITSELKKMRLLQIENDEINSIANEMKFPTADSDTQKKLYEQIDAWNISFPKEMRFEQLVEKMMLRRVSSRYLSVIQAHCKVMLDLVRASDELDSEHNDDVLMLNVSIQSGFLPG